MRGLLAFLTWWMTTGWVWIFFLEVNHGYAHIIEPNLAILYLEFSLAIGLSLFTMGYLAWLVIKKL